MSRTLSVGPATWLGDRSYGWYLWHRPAIVFARATWATEAWWVLPAVAAAALVPTCLSYRWLEWPLRRNPGLAGRRTLALAAVCIVVPLTASRLVWSLGNAVADSGMVRVSEQFAPHLGDVHACHVGDVNATLANPACSWTVPDARGRIVFVGDSNAGHLVEGLMDSAQDADYDLTVATYDGCPLATLTLIDNHPAFRVPGAQCRGYVHGVIQRLTADPPSLVVIGSVSDIYVRDSGIEFARSDGSIYASTSEDKTRLWQEGLGTVLAALTDADVPVAVVHPAPHFLDWDPRGCGPDRLSRGDRGRVLNRDETEALRAGVVAAAADAPGATTVDLDPELCLVDGCATNDGGRWIYRDGLHITVGASRRLAPRYAQLIEDHAQPRP